MSSNSVCIRSICSRKLAPAALHTSPQRSLERTTPSAVMLIAVLLIVALPLERLVAFVDPPAPGVFWPGLYCSSGSRRTSYSSARKACRSAITACCAATVPRSCSISPSR